MNQYLYVCHFSNGHIKVGRSIDPVARIAQHAERVSCMGVELIEHHMALCVSHVIPSEAALINLCIGASAKRHQNEWFEGVDYLQACEWANECAETTHSEAQPPEDNPNGISKTEAISILGGTPKKAAFAMGYKTPHAIYMWPDFLTGPVADRVRGVAARLGESA